MDGFLLGVVAGFMLGTLCCLVLMVFAFDRVDRFEHKNVDGVTHTRKRRWPRVL